MKESEEKPSGGSWTRPMLWSSEVVMVESPRARGGVGGGGGGGEGEGGGDMLHKKKHLMEKRKR